MESLGGVIRLLHMQICSHNSAMPPMDVALSRCLQKDSLYCGMGWDGKAKRSCHVIQDAGTTWDLSSGSTTLCLKGTCRLGTCLL